MLLSPPVGSCRRAGVAATRLSLSSPHLTSALLSPQRSSPLRPCLSPGGSGRRRPRAPTAAAVGGRGPGPRVPPGASGCRARGPQANGRRGGAGGEGAGAGNPRRSGGQVGAGLAFPRGRSQPGRLRPWAAGRGRPAAPRRRGFWREKAPRRDENTLQKRRRRPEPPTTAAAAVAVEEGDVLSGRFDSTTPPPRGLARCQSPLKDEPRRRWAWAATLPPARPAPCPGAAPPRQRGAALPPSELGGAARVATCGAHPAPPPTCCAPAGAGGAGPPPSFRKPEATDGGGGGSSPPMSPERPKRTWFKLAFCKVSSVRT